VSQPESKLQVIRQTKLARLNQIPVRRFFCDPCDLLQQSDEAAAQQEWEQSTELLEQACTLYERGDAYSAESSIPVYCRLAAIYFRTNRSDRAREIIVKVTGMLQEGHKVVPGSVTLLAMAANLASRHGLSGDADVLYKLVMPKWTELLPFEFVQFNLCLRDALPVPGQQRLLCARTSEWANCLLMPD